MTIRKFIPLAEPVFLGNEKKYVDDCMNSTWISSSGKYIDAFEKEFEKKFKEGHSIAVSNGTAALHLALLGLNIQPGDEIIVPDLTFVAVPNVVKYVGATPILCDVDNYFNINPDIIEEKITPKTKAIIAVDSYGNFCRADKLRKIADDYNLKLIIDRAEAIKPKENNYADITTYSYFSNKVFVTGEGGMICCKDEKISDRLRYLKDHGMTTKKRYWHNQIGYNYRMTNIQAAIGLAQLETLDENLKRRDEIQKLYNKYLDRKSLHDVCWLYSLITKNKNNEYGELNRDGLCKFLLENGIDNRRFFYPLHSLPMYKEENNYPNATLFSESGINLPTSLKITDEEIEYISKKIKEYYKI